MALNESPSQTAGPYVHIGCAPQTAGLEQRGMGPEFGGTMVLDGDAISVEIAIFDGADEPVKDALVETWQANPDGAFTPTPKFRNWGRQATNFETGRVRFETLKPGPNGAQAPHILVWIAARGINLGLTTRVYFPDEDNVTDPVFVRAGARAETLVATKTDTGYFHTICLQGENETVFFDV